MPVDTASIPRRRVRWRSAYRIVPSRYPPVGPWDRIARPEDFDALAAIEGLTNPRLREELGVLALVPQSRRVAGPGTTPIMAAFTHLNPEGSRFSDGSYGVLYVSREQDTAIRETVFHRERFLARTREPTMQLPMRCYQTAIDRQLHDLRGGYPALHDPDVYSHSQAVARELRGRDADGIVYDSVRNRGGQCAALFWPDCAAPFTQSRHLAYCWDGAAITQVLEMTAITLSGTSGTRRDPR